MAIVASDLKKFGAASYPEADTGTTGGAITLTTTVKRFIQASNTAPKLKSTNAGDTMNVTIWGRDTTGAIVSETKALTGTTLTSAFSNTYVYIIKITLASAAAGTVTLYMNDGTTSIVDIDAGVTKNMRLFYAASSEASQAIRYEKEYWKNNHGSLTLQSPKATLTTDAAARIKIGKENSASQTSTDRKTAPSSVSFSDDNVDVTLSDLTAGSSVGIWVQQDLPANDPAINNFYTTQLSGQTAA